MTTPELVNILRLINRRFKEKQIPFAMIGAMALAMYGIPRFTTDIDLLSDDRNRSEIVAVLERLGYTCFQHTDQFAQFDSELGVFGKVDLMFVTTADGRGILDRRVAITDELLGSVPIIQPSDYIILKIMAVANNPERHARDVADIGLALMGCLENRIPMEFETIDQERILRFAERFDKKHLAIKIFKRISEKNAREKVFYL